MIRLAVITHPRSGSRSLADTLVRDHGKIGRGSINFAQSVASDRITDEQIVSGDYVLHGHWHTIDQLSPEIQDHIRDNCTVHHIERPAIHRMLSSVIVMATKKVNFSEDEIPNIIDVDLVQEYVRRMAPATHNLAQWVPTRIHRFDDLYNGMSTAMFEKNRSRIDNYDELLESYEAVTGGIDDGCI